MNAETAVAALRLEEYTVESNLLLDQINAYVKENILSDVYKENEKVSERVICEHFHTSRTVVREAFFELNKKGWLYARSKSGAYVAPPDLAVIHENDLARLALEPDVMMMAYPNLTPADFAAMREYCAQMQAAQAKGAYSIAENRQHILISQRTNNRFVSSFISAIWNSITRARHWSFLPSIS